jgi:hypothetical protein
MALLALLTLILPPARAFAQTNPMPRVEVSLGWQYLYDTNIVTDIGGGGHAARGWYGDLAVNVTPALGIVGEVGWASWDAVTSGPLGGGPQFITLPKGIRTVMGGIRGNARRESMVVPFGQVLFGEAAHDLFGYYDRHLFEVSPALQVGGGANVMLTKSIGMRVETSYRTMFHRRGVNQLRVAVGVIVAMR